MCSVQENIAKKAVLVTATSTSASVSASMAYMKEGGGGRYFLVNWLKLSVIMSHVTVSRLSGFIEKHREQNSEQKESNGNIFHINVSMIDSLTVFVISHVFAVLKHIVIT